MPLSYLLDTNILSDLIRHPQGRVASRIAAVGEDSICTSIIVASELRFGVSKSGSTKLANRIDVILSALDVLAIEVPADRYYANVRWDMTRRGIPIGPNDLLIAAQALSLGLTVVTANSGEFSRVPALKVENWLAE